MDSPSHGFEQLLNRVGAGSERAADELHAMFRSRLLKAVRRKLPRKLRPKFDSVDFTQDAWLAFWKKYRDHPGFPHRDAFAAFLTRVAENIVTDMVRQRLQREKFNVNREVPLGGGERRPHEVADRGPTPSQVAMGHEEWLRFLEEQPPVVRRILIMYRAGLSAAEIADELRLNRRYVHRAIQMVLQRHESQ
jgi:RNA polymerase sigma-70 factor (ECF subfamily)